MKVKNILIGSMWKDGWGRTWMVTGKANNRIEMTLLINPTATPIQISASEMNKNFYLVSN